MANEKKQVFKALFNGTYTRPGIIRQDNPRIIPAHTHHTTGTEKELNTMLKIAFSAKSNTL